MTPPPNEVPSLFDSVADLLPSHLREHFYRRMAHLSQLSPNDDILHIVEAMGFLALIIRDTPSLVAEERQRFDTLLTGSANAIRDTFDAAIAYHQLLDNRLQQLPIDIHAAISPDAIAAHLSEALRQQLVESGLPEWAGQIAIHTAALSTASKNLSSSILQFTDPNTGATQRLNTALSSMQSNLKNAADHVRCLADTLQKELFTSLVVLSLGAATIGFFLGTLYAHYSH